jgi:hypothetical protein
VLRGGSCIGHSHNFLSSGAGTFSPGRHPAAGNFW